ncbi:MAG: hypothetical protein KGK07_06385 [Chloroflexota bacterium]|nr:hypothetical protein [Chloroflexota bacterium]
MSPLELVLALFVLAPAAGTAATVYLWILYRSDTARPRSWLLAMLWRGSSVVSIVALYLAALAAVRLADLDVPRWTGVPTALALLALEAVPVYYAAVMYGRGRVTKARRR